MSKVFTEEKILSYLEDKFSNYKDDVAKEDILEDLVSGIESLSSDTSDNLALYTNRDAQDIRNYLVDTIKTLTTEWTDFNESDVGATIIELLAGFADYLGFYLDKQSLESFLPTVKQRKNGAAILSLINYKLGMTNSCITNGRFVFPQSYETDIEIPKYLQVSAIQDDGTKVYYATKDSTLLKAGLRQVDTTLIQGVVTRSIMKVSDLRNSQKIRIAANNIANGSLEIYVGGELWTEVPDVIIDDVPGPKYSFYENKNCEPIILFHNNYRDYLPEDDSATVEMIYLVSLGAEGKIKAGAISKMESPFEINGLDIKDKLEIINTEVASGGSSRETLDEARVQAPKTLSTLGKAIILSDYEELASGLPGVLKCKALDWSIPGDYVKSPFLVELYIVPTDGTECSNAQLQGVVDYFDNGVKMSPVTVKAYDAEYVAVDISMIVHASVSTNKEATLKKLIESTIKNKFDPKNGEFGDKIGKSSITNLIENCSDSIDYVELITPDNNLSLKLNQFPKLGDLDIIIVNN